MLFVVIILSILFVVIIFSILKKKATNHIIWMQRKKKPQPYPTIPTKATLQISRLWRWHPEMCHDRACRFCVWCPMAKKSLTSTPRQGSLWWLQSSWWLRQHENTAEDTTVAGYHGLWFLNPTVFMLATAAPSPMSIFRSFTRSWSFLPTPYENDKKFKRTLTMAESLYGVTLGKIPE